jgi:TonB family protein
LWFSHAGLQRTARTPIELEETTLVEMELDPFYLGGPVYIGRKISTINGQSKSKLQKGKQTIQAAEKMVKGKVVDANAKPLERASVVVAGKTIGTVTDKDGVFSLNLSDTSSIVVSYVGFKSVKLAPDFEKSMIINMEPENIEIDNVVVVGYGIRTQNKEKLTIKGTNNEENSNTGSKKIFTVVEQMPEFPGGSLALRKYIAQQIKYPSIAQENGIQGHVYVSFVINSFGVVSDAKIARSVDPALDNEAIRVIYSMPKWKPGFQQGKAVDVAYTVPITFILQ